MEPTEILGDPPETVTGGHIEDWRWFDKAEVTLEAENLDQEFIDIVSGGASIPANDVTAGPVHMTVPTAEGKKIDFILYKVQFQPFKFNYWNKWHKRLVKRLFGVKFAYWLYYRNALKISYSGKALMNHHERSTIQSLWADLDPALKQLKDEARELRDSVDSPANVETPEDTHERLKSARRAQDRLEGILADVGLIRSRVRKLVADLDEAYDDAWTDAMNRTRIGEYTSAKERDATYATGAIQERINLRRAKRWLADVEEVYDFVYLKHRGLDAVRNDAKSTLRYAEFEAHYER